MGSDKGSLELGPATMIDLVVSSLLPVVDETYFVGGNHVHPDAVLLADRYVGEGPLGGLATAFETLSDQDWTADIVVLVSCDLAQLTSEAITQLLQAQHASDADYVVPLVDGHRQWHCSIWHRRCGPTISGAFASGVRSFRPAVADLRECAVIPQRFEPFDDVDTKEQYERVRRRYRAIHAD